MILPKQSPRRGVLDIGPPFNKFIKSNSQDLNLHTSQPEVPLCQAMAPLWFLNHKLRLHTYFIWQKNTVLAFGWRLKHFNSFSLQIRNRLWKGFIQISLDKNLHKKKMELLLETENTNGYKWTPRKVYLTPGELVKKENRCIENFKKGQ